MGTIFKVNRFDDDNAPNKVAIEIMFATLAGERMSCDALCVCGPNYKRHADNIIRRVATAQNAVFAVAEIEDTTRAIIQREMADCEVTRQYRRVPFTRAHSRHGLQKGLPMIYGDVLDIKRSFRFEDLDLTASWLNTFDVFYDRLKKQAMDERQNRLKCMICTVSQRKSGGPEHSVDRVNDLMSLLGAKLAGFNNIVGGFDTENKDCNSREDVSKRYKYVQQPNWLVLGRVQEFRAYKYSDSGNPMFTFMVMYY